MKFRVKPFTVDAEQWYPDKPVTGANVIVEGSVGIFKDHNGHTYTLKPGDWIVTNANGVRQAYSQKNFEAIYDPLNPEDLAKVIRSLISNWHKTKGALPEEIELGEYLLMAVGLDEMNGFRTEFGASVPVKLVKGDKIVLKEKKDEPTQAFV